MRALAHLGRRSGRAFAAAALLILLAGVPAFLALAFGWPLPTSLPTSHDAWQQLLTAPIPDTAILRLLAVTGWLLWIGFARAVWVEARDGLRGIHTTYRLPHMHPLRGLAAFLIVTLAVGGIAGTAPAQRARAVTAAPPTVPVAAVLTVDAPALSIAPGGAPPANTHTAPLLPAGPAILRVNGCSHLHTVVKGESLWAIAKTCLGDGTRWPEIWQLNEGKFWPEVSGYKHFTNPNLIYPRWTLELPTDAVAPPGDPKVTPTDPKPTTPQPAETGGPTPQQTTPAPPTTTPATAIVAPTSTSTASPTPSSTGADPTTTASPTDSPSPSPVVVDDEHGVTLPDGSWVPWALAAAIAAASALVWLQRRRRHVAGSGEDEYPDLPAPVRQLDGATRHNPDLPKPTDEVDKAGNVPPQALPALGGVGLIGEGATAAARAALVTALAAGGPHNPHDRAEIIIDADTLATLVGPDAVQLAEWPRLHIADDTDAALLKAEAEILRRGRILSYHAAPTPAALRQQVPDEEALPQLLLLCQAPPETSPAMRLKVTAGIGARLNITTLVIGEWRPGPTLHVTADGHTRLVGDHTSEHTLPDRMAVLEPDTAAQILLTLREAHTGLRPERSTPARSTVRAVEPTRADTALIDDGGRVPDEQPAQPAAPPVGAPAKARLRVLGPPDIDNVTTPGRPLRAKARELAVFLACHPDGVATRDIGEHLAPDYTLSKADQQVHTNASNLRHVFARAAGPREDGYIQRMPGETTSRYRLDPATVEVDLWQLRELLRAASLASGERRRYLLAAACALYTGPLAEGYDYEWISPFRETARRWGTEAHQLYAETLLDSDPLTAADILDHAIRMDRHNEQLYVQAMHARHALRNCDGLRVIMRALTKALAEIDAEPSEETNALYQRLRAGLDQR